MLPTAVVSFGQPHPMLSQAENPAISALDLDTLVFSIHAELQELPHELAQEALDIFAARYITNPALAVLLANFSWKSLSVAIEKIIINCQLQADAARITQAFKRIYYASLSNSSSKQLYEQTLKDLEQLVATSQVAELEKRHKKATRLLQNGFAVVGQKPEKWQRTKTKIVQISTLRFYTDPLALERLSDLATILLDNPDDEFERDAVRHRKFVAFAKNIREHELFIVHVAKLSLAFVEAEIAFNKAHAASLCPPKARDALYHSHFMPFTASYIEASATFLKKLLIKDIRKLPDSPGKTKIAIQKAVVAALQQIAKETGDDPLSWKKVRKETKNALKSRVTEKFITIYWDHFFQEAQEFDLQEFAWSVLQKAPKAIQDNLEKHLRAKQATHQAALKTCKEDVTQAMRAIHSQELRELVYREIFKPLKKIVRSTSDITP